VPDGRHFGRIVAAYVAPDELVFDVQDLIPGDTEDGAYTIRDVEPGNVSLPVASDVTVTRVSCDAGCAEGITGDYGTLTTTVQPSDGYRVTIEDGVVVAIDQQYLA
jgi:hypothetical protein